MKKTVIRENNAGVIYRAETLQHAGGYFRRMFTEFHFGHLPFGKTALLYIAVLLLVEWFMRERQFGLQLSDKGLLRYRVVRWTIYVALFLSVLFLAGEKEDFIYFQF